MSPKKAADGPALPGAVWLRERPPRRGNHGLTRERIAAEAVVQLDRSGPAGLTLRSLADALGVHATTLYWHVAVRDDLLDLALDAVFGELALPDAPAESWLDDVGSFMRDLRAALLRHPWSGALAGSRPLLGPEALARSEFVYATLARGGLAGTRLTAAAATVTNLVVGSVATEASWRDREEAEARAAVHRYLAEHAGSYPVMAEMVPQAGDWAAQFEQAVRFLLAGLEREAASPPL